MAKAAWCTVAPTSGNENRTIVISAAAHTGRAARSTTVTVQNQSGTKPSKEISVNQVEKVLSISKISGATPASIPATGGIVVVTGTSNAKTIALFEDNDFMNAHEFKANGVLQADAREDCTSPWFVITGDPGATAEYSFESKVTLPANPTAQAREFTIYYEAYSVLEPQGGATEVFTVKVSQAGATSTLSTDKASISLVSAGTAQNVAITSNDNWIVL